MVSLNISETAQLLYIPRDGWTPSDAPTLTARSTSDLTEVAFTVSGWSVSGHFLRLTVELPEDGLFVGEWEYTCTVKDADGNTATLTGLLQVTEDETEANQYNKEITYKQYGE